MGGSEHETGIGSKLRSTHHVVNKNNERIENFKKVREAALCNAVDSHSRHIMRDHRDKLRAKKFRELVEEKKDFKAMAYVKFYEKHGEATERWTSFDKDFTRKGLEAAK